MKNIRGGRNGTLIMLFSIACLCILYTTYILISPEDQKETNYTFRKAVRFDTKTSRPHNKTIKGEGINKHRYISISGGGNAYAKKEYVNAQNISATHFHQIKSSDSNNTTSQSNNTTSQSAKERSATKAPSLPDMPLDGELYVLLWRNIHSSY